MKSKEDYEEYCNLWVHTKDDERSRYEVGADFANEHAQSLAKEVVEELEGQEPMISRAKIVALIKEKFDLI